MNFPEYRTLAERGSTKSQRSKDEFESKQIESPRWVQKYLDLADRAIQHSNEYEETLERQTHFRRWQR